MRNSILGICMVLMIVILFFYGMVIGSLRLKVQTLEDSIENNNLWGVLEQTQNASLEALKKVNRLK